MKQNTLKKIDIKGQRVLILSDGKPGHFNQAIALARLLGCDYDVVKVGFRFRGAKALSYCLDRCGVYCSGLFHASPPPRHYAAVVSAGSATYYANRTLAKKLGCPAVAIMFPRGYRLSFDLIIAQHHDHPPQAENILTIPVNLSYSQPVGLVTPAPGQRYLGLIIGGDSAHGKLSAEGLKKQIDDILRLLPDHRVWLTTSRRTSAEVESMLEQYHFDYAVFYSKQQVNPIPDFLEYCDFVFITADSSSMISEAVANGQAAVEILPISGSFVPTGKFKALLAPLLADGCVHIFDGTIKANAQKKINLKAMISS